MRASTGTLTKAEPRRSSLGAFRHRSFAVFWTAAAISNAGSWMQVVAVPALLFELTGSSTWLGVSSMASLAPAVLITPFAGAIADRISRRRILLITQALQMTVAFTMLFMYRADALRPGLIVWLGLVTGIATGFQAAVWQSFVPLLVPRALMLDAVKLNSMQFTLARVLGPAFAGVAVKTWGYGAAFSVNGLTYLLVIGALVIAHTRPTDADAGGLGVRAAVASGARYMFRHRPLRLAVYLAFLSAACGQSLQHVAPAVAERMLGRTPKDNAGLLVALGLGATVSSGVSVVIGDRLRRSRRVALGLVLFGVSAAMLAVVHDYRWGLVAYFLGGIAHLQIAIALNTLVQGLVPDAYRGRAMSFYVLGVIAGLPFGSFALGRLGDVLSMRSAVRLDAIALAVALVALAVTGSFRALDTTSLPAGPGDE